MTVQYDAARDEVKIRGRLKTWIEPKGFGFLAADDGNDYFIHIKALQRSGYSEPMVDDVYEFSPAPGRDGRMQADNLKRVG